jgi:hypothetical protein
VRRAREPVSAARNTGGLKIRTAAISAAAAAMCLLGGAAMATEKYPSKPVSCGYYPTTPYVISGQNPGGNRTYAEVGKVFYNDPYYYNISFGKIDVGNLKDYLPN